MSDAKTNEARPEESRRDPEHLKAVIGDWLAGRPTLSGAEVTKVDVPESNGMSSETVLVDASWTEDGTPKDAELVFRIAPKPSTVPVFENYDLESQFRVMADVARLSDVPVPKVLWLEMDEGPVGSQFFVMERSQGQVPPDVLPYNFGDTFLFDASPEDQDRLESNSVDVLARLHAIADPLANFSYLDGADSSTDASNGDAFLRHHIEKSRKYYEWVIRDGHPSPLVERGFEWLENHWPKSVGPASLSWGDARIGNMMFNDFKPSAVLDWEMASIAPREVDLSWMIFLHQFFEDITRMMDLPGMPQFMERDRVVAKYTAATGYEPRDMDFYVLYSALQHGIIMSQVQRRAIRFGAAEMPEDVDDMIMHRDLLTAMIEA
ncbi:MAG TPA: phosphotransferase family protein [Microthrixaceae bacterium]|nr:phosphotransferase family protein [Microthrixaceae bacterium]